MDNFFLLHLPSVEQWATRIWNNADTADLLRKDSTFFSHWYLLLLASAPAFTTEAREAITDVESRDLTFEEAAQLLEHANLSTSEKVDLVVARKLLEGYELWKLYRQSPSKVLVNGVLDTPGLRQDADRCRKTSRAGQLAAALKLGDLEAELLFFAVTQRAMEQLGMLVRLATHRSPRAASRFWLAVFDCTEAELSKVLGNSVLRHSRLLRVTHDGAPQLTPYWNNRLMAAGGAQELLEELVEPLPTKTGTGVPARLADEDRDLAVKILSAPVEQGVNLMLYGAEGLEQRGQLRALLGASKRRAVTLRKHPDLEDGDYAALAYVAQRLLAAKDPTAVLVIDKAHEALSRRVQSSFMMAFGFKEESTGELSPHEETLLQQSPVTTLWTGPGVKSLPEECLSQFVFHAPLRRARRQDRRAQLEAQLDELKLSPETRAELLGLEEISAQQLQSGLRAARLSAPRSTKQKEAVLVQAVRRSLKVLNRATTAVAKDCVTTYSLEYINHRGRFGPADLVKAFKRNPKGSLCLYGAPGTGKTQFVEHLAQQLGMPLIIKQASDLMSKWLGESEKNIAAAFEEAESQEAILFLDEGDSFLRDRNQARASWEVTQVNELLQHMERFPGIFVVATNLFKGLDAAALRRFTFKMELLELDADQRWKMFVQESGIARRKTPLPDAEREVYFDTLLMLPRLAAGDFATVKRQCDVLGIKMTPKQWLEQLRIECELKTKDVTNQGGLSLH